MVNTLSRTNLGLNQQTYQRLKAALRLNLRRQVFIGVCDNLVLRDRLSAQLQDDLLYRSTRATPKAAGQADAGFNSRLHLPSNQALQNYPRLVSLYLDVNNPDPLAGIAKWLMQRRANAHRRRLPMPAFQLLGVEQLSRQPAAIQWLFLNYLQGIERSLPALDSSLLIWIPRPWARMIPQSAPDFWRCRTAVFEFAGDPTPLTFTIAPEPSYSASTQGEWSTPVSEQAAQASSLAQSPAHSNYSAADSHAADGDRLPLHNSAQDEILDDIDDGLEDLISTAEFPSDDSAFLGLSHTAEAATAEPSSFQDSEAVVNESEIIDSQLDEDWTIDPVHVDADLPTAEINELAADVSSETTDEDISLTTESTSDSLSTESGPSETPTDAISTESDLPELDLSEAETAEAIAESVASEAMVTESSIADSILPESEEPESGEPEINVDEVDRTDAIASEPLAESLAESRPEPLPEPLPESTEAEPSTEVDSSTDTATVPEPSEGEDAEPSIEPSQVGVTEPPTDTATVADTADLENLERSSDESNAPELAPENDTAGNDIDTTGIDAVAINAIANVADIPPPSEAIVPLPELLAEVDDLVAVDQNATSYLDVILETTDVPHTQPEEEITENATSEDSSDAILDGRDAAITDLLQSGSLESGSLESDSESDNAHAVAEESVEAEPLALAISETSLSESMVGNDDIVPDDTDQFSLLDTVDDLSLLEGYDATATANATFEMLQSPESTKTTDAVDTADAVDAGAVDTNALNTDTTENVDDADIDDEDITAPINLPQDTSSEIQPEEVQSEIQSIDTVDSPKVIDGADVAALTNLDQTTLDQLNVEIEPTEAVDATSSDAASDAVPLDLVNSEDSDAVDSPGEHRPSPIPTYTPAVKSNPLKSAFQDLSKLLNHSLSTKRNDNENNTAKADDAISNESDTHELDDATTHKSDDNVLGLTGFDVLDSLDAITDDLLREEENNDASPVNPFAFDESDVEALASSSPSPGPNTGPSTDSLANGLATDESSEEEWVVNDFPMAQSEPSNGQEEQDSLDLDDELAEDLPQDLEMGTLIHDLETEEGSTTEVLSKEPTADESVPLPLSTDLSYSDPWVPAADTGMTMADGVSEDSALNGAGLDGVGFEALDLEAASGDRPDTLDIEDAPADHNTDYPATPTDDNADASVVDATFDPAIAALLNGAAANSHTLTDHADTLDAFDALSDDLEVADATNGFLTPDLFAADDYESSPSTPQVADQDGLDFNVFDPSDPAVRPLLQQIADLQHHNAEALLLAEAFRNLGNFYRDRIEQGDVSPQNLIRSMQAYKQVLPRIEDTHPMWAEVLNDMGNLCWLLSRGAPSPEQGLPHLQQGIQSYRMALTKINPETEPQTYPMIQNNLGAAYGDLARYQDPVVNLQNSIHAYQEALLYRSIDREPMRYASTQNNLGTTYWNLAQHVDPTENLKQAIESYSEALRLYRPDTDPLNYAMIQNNLGTTYWNLAQHEQSGDWLRLAIMAYETALKFRTMETNPSAFAATQNNLGTAYWHVATYVEEDAEEKLTALKHAIRSYDAALSAVKILEYQQHPTPLNFDVLATYNNLGLVQYQLSTEPDIQMLDNPDTKGYLDKAIDNHLVALQGWQGRPELRQTALGCVIQTLQAIYNQKGLTAQNLALSKIPGHMLPEIMPKL